MDPLKLYCDICGSHKTNKIDLIRHMKVHASSISKLSPEKSNRKRRKQTGGSKSCDICSTSFCRKRELTRHMKTAHHQFTNDEKPIIPFDYKPRAWICEACGREYKSKHALNYHINGAHVEAVVKNYSCNVCDYKCREARNLVSHRLVHSKEKEHQCSECGKSFRFRTSLARHILCVHKREKRYKCTICDKSFYSTLRVKEHFSVHTGQHPLKCTLCTRTYRYKNSLLKHMRKRHRDARKRKEEI